VTTPEAPKTRRKADRLLGSMLAGKYKILKKIGEGGMGSVYIANQEPIDRKVAVKVLLGKLAEDEISVRRFEQEARAISKMQHPNTVTIYDFGRTDDGHDSERLYIVMEYLKGRTLTQVLRADHQLAGPRASRIVRQVCASLADAHGAGIIHRDLKPDNIFLTEVGGDRDWVKVLDFGVAKLADSESAGTLTQTGMIFGTPKYMSPEQAEGRPLDYRADIYALGVILYELLTGRPPFVADTPVGLLLKHISESPPSFGQLRPDLQVDPRLEQIVMKALSKAPDDRFQMVGELAAELEAYERAASGGYVIPTGTVPTPMSHGLPTEVVPGAPQPAMTPAELKSPDAVPPNLSEGVAAPTAGSATAPDQSLATHALSPGQSTVAAPGATVQAPARGGKKSSAAVLAGVAVVFAGLGLAAVMMLQPAERESSVDDVQSLSAPPVVELDPGPVDPTPDQTDPDPEPLPVDPSSLVLGGRKPKADPPTKPRSDAEPKKDPVPAQIEVSFDSQPSGAVVWMGGKQIGLTPFSSQFERGRELEFTVRKRGYVAARKRLTPEEDTDVKVALTKRSRPKPKPKPQLPPTTDKGANQKVSDLK
jgi:serine/threonine protein kinase